MTNLFTWGDIGLPDYLLCRESGLSALYWLVAIWTDIQVQAGPVANHVALLGMRAKQME